MCKHSSLCVLVECFEYDYRVTIVQLRLSRAVATQEGPLDSQAATSAMAPRSRVVLAAVGAGVLLALMVLTGNVHLTPDTVAAASHGRASLEPSRASVTPTASAAHLFTAPQQQLQAGGVRGRGAPASAAAPAVSAVGPTVTFAKRAGSTVAEITQRVCAATPDGIAKQAPSRPAAAALAPQVLAQWDQAQAAALSGVPATSEPPPVRDSAARTPAELAAAIMAIIENVWVDSASGSQPMAAPARSPGSTPAATPSGTAVATPGSLSTEVGDSGPCSEFRAHDRPELGCMVLHESGGGSVPGVQVEGAWTLCADTFPSTARDPGRCVVYSFGINGDFSFDDYWDATMGCRVHAFDPSMGVDTHERSARVTFHNVGVAGEDGTLAVRREVKVSSAEVKRLMDLYGPQGPPPEQWRMMSLPSVMSELGHTRAQGGVDIVKMDVEGSEWRVLDTCLREGCHRSIRQLALEIHFWPQDSWDHRERVITAQDLQRWLSVLQRLLDGGFQLVYAHKNPFGHAGTLQGVETSTTLWCCWELTFTSTLPWPISS